MYKQEPFKILISNVCEIRMGSPYKGCSIELENKNISLPDRFWQDKFSWSEDYKYLILVYFDLRNNDAVFHFYIINIETNNHFESERILGLLNNLHIKNNKIYYSKFYYQKSIPIENSNYDEEYILTTN